MNEFMCASLNGESDARPTTSMLNITLIAPWAAYRHLLPSLTHGACGPCHLHTLSHRLHTFSTGVYIGAIALRGLAVVGSAPECGTAQTAFTVCLLQPKIVTPASNNDGGHAPCATSL